MVFSFNKDTFLTLEPFVNANLQMENTTPPETRNPTTMPATPPTSSTTPMQTHIFTPTPSINYPTTKVPTSTIDSEKPRVLVTPSPPKDIFGDLLRRVSQFVQKNDTVYFIFIFIVTMIGVLFIISVCLPLIKRFVRRRKERYGTYVSY
tara:strand:- start:177 stop:623 length:447 start_codon:yes stop_codon:yes gene_type:complete